ncbi:MAG: hypothetical protein ACXWV5_00365 [Flavitalea sp.]
MNSRTFKDWLIVVLLLGAGLFYLFLQVVSILQNGFTLLESSGDNILISRSEVLYELRTWLTIVFCIMGGIAYYQFRKTGWILAVGMLALFVLISAGGIATIFTMGLIDISTYLLGLIAILLLFAFIKLFTPATRKQFSLNRNDFLIAGVFTVLLLLFYFVVQ